MTINRLPPAKLLQKISHSKEKIFYTLHEADSHIVQSQPVTEFEFGIFC